MKNINFKTIQKTLFSLLIIFSFFTVSTIVFAQATLETKESYTDEKYTPLAPLPGFEEVTEDGTGAFDFSGPCPLGRYLSVFINVFIGIIAVISMVMIIMGGIEYVMSDLSHGKGEAKTQITNAIFGLLIALSAYLILNTINPDLLNLCLNGIPKATIAVDGIEGDEGASNFEKISEDELKKLGVNCPGTGARDALPAIAKSFIGKVKYSTSSRGTISGNKIYLDCSSFVSQVYACAGLSSPGNTTAGMFNSGNATGASQNSTNFTRGLAIGSLLGWEKGQSSRYKSAGHVVMYIGNGEFIEVNSKSGATVRPLSSYAGNYYHLIK